MPLRPLTYQVPAIQHASRLKAKSSRTELFFSNVAQKLDQENLDGVEKLEFQMKSEGGESDDGAGLE